jgi:hypothetical protein
VRVLLLKNAQPCQCLYRTVLLKWRFPIVISVERIELTCTVDVNMLKVGEYFDESRSGTIVTMKEKRDRERLAGI